jgi:hypothetical protein
VGKNSKQKVHALEHGGELGGEKQRKWICSRVLTGQGKTANKQKGQQVWSREGTKKRKENTVSERKKLRNCSTMKEEIHGKIMHKKKATKSKQR